MTRTIAGMAVGVLAGLLLGAPVSSFGHAADDEQHERDGMGQMMSDPEMREHAQECVQMMRDRNDQTGSMMRDGESSMGMMGSHV
jgi:hypothetical protein